MPTELKAIPYWRLSSFYFFNCAVLGAMLPYWGLYLQDLGYTATQIGSIGAILMATNIVAPNIWGWLADHTGRRLLIIRSGTLLACLSFLGVFFIDSFIELAFLIGCCSFCWQGLNSQFEVITLGHLKGQTQRYGHIRLWGSVGFIVAVSCLGAALDYISIRHLPKFLIGFLLLMWLSTLSVSEGKVPSHHESQQGLWQILKRRAVWGLLLAVGLLQLSHGAYYTFYSLYLDSYGYGRMATGGLWSLAVVAEVGMFLIMYKLIPRLGVRNILLLSLVVAVVRWWGIAYLAESLVALALAQLLHAFTFPAIHTVMIELIRRHFGTQHQGQGQALYSSLCIGGGSALGAALSGRLWDWSPAGTFGCAAMVAALALVVAWLWVYPPSDTNPGELQER